MWIWTFLTFSGRLGVVIFLFAFTSIDTRLWHRQVSRIQPPVVSEPGNYFNKKHSLLVCIKENGDIVLDKSHTTKISVIKRIDYKLLGPRLVEIFKHQKNYDPYLVIEILADKNCSMEPVLYLHSILKKAELYRICYIVKPVQNSIKNYFHFARHCRID